MYTLYYSPGAASMLVHLTLLELDVPFELKRVDIDSGEHRDPAYLALNPHGKLPTLVIDGVAHGEAAALAALLAERHPQAALAPAPGSPRRPDYLQWMFHLANELQPRYRQWFYPNEHGAVDADAVRQVARVAIESCWSRIDGHLGSHGPYMLGADFSGVDLYMLMLMRWSRNMPRPVTAWPHLAAFAALMKNRPSWKRLCETEGLVEWA